jgi:hypothetical protein
VCWDMVKAAGITRWCGDGGLATELRLIRPECAGLCGHEHQIGDGDRLPQDRGEARRAVDEEEVDACRAQSGKRCGLPWSSMPGAARSSAGPWRTTCAPNWRSMHSKWPLVSALRVTSSITATRAAQYTSLAFGKRCQEAGVRPSMGSVGDAYDNACARASLPPRNASCWIAAGSCRRSQDGLLLLH